MEVSTEIVREEIVEICRRFNWEIAPRSFQIEFFVKAVDGLSGFLEAPCGSGKSMLYQLLPFVLKTFRFADIPFPVVLVVEPLTAISEGQVQDQKVPSIVLSETGYFTMLTSNGELKRYPIADIEKLSSFSGVIFSSPEVLFVKTSLVLLNRSNEYFKTSKYNLTLGTQLSLDNVDLVLKNKLEHWILCYSRMDPLDCKHLSNELPAFDVTKVTADVVYLKTNEVNYLNKICQTVLTKKMAEFFPGLSFILKHVPFEPLHKHKDMFTKQDVFVEMLEPLNEMEHGDMARMLSMCQSMVLKRLNTLTGFEYDDEIQTTINQSGTVEEIKKAEDVVRKQMEEWGNVILGGDLLTVERIEQNKSLRQSNMSHFEKLGFLGQSRVAVFHFRKNLVLKLFATLLPNLENSDNPGSLNTFRALTIKAKDLSNRESRIKDSFELHFQFILAVSEIFLEQKLKSTVKDALGVTDVKKVALILKSKTEAEFIELLESVVNRPAHLVFINGAEQEANSDHFDDLENMGSFFVSVWFILKSLDFIVKTGDPEGIRMFKKNGILLTLSLHSTSSKYVHHLFQELMAVEQMSERQVLRWSSGHFIKFHGKQSEGDKIRPQDMNLRAEDMVCEWMVEKVKNSLKSLGGNYTEETVEKKTKATSLVGAILDHDCRSLLNEVSSGPGHSWSRFDDEELQRFRDYVESLKPFSPDQRNPVSYTGRRIPKSLYSNLNEELVTKFFSLKLENLK